MFKKYLRLIICRSCNSLIIACLMILTLQPTTTQGFYLPRTLLAASNSQNSILFLTNPPPQIPRCYLPLIIGGYGSGIFGYVTQASLPANNVYLTLRKTDGTGNALQNIATTTSNGDGYFQFIGQDPPPPGQYFQVVYNSQNPKDPISGRIGWWKTKLIAPTVKGQNILIGIFDIADIGLGDPSTEFSSHLPVTFNWTPRVKSPSDSYRLEIVFFVPPSSYTEEYHSPLTGYASSFTFSVTQWPSTYVYDKKYSWYVSVEAPDTAAGASSVMHFITFLANP